MIFSKEQLESANESSNSRSYIKPIWTKFPFGSMGLAFVFALILILARAVGMLGSVNFRWLLPLGFLAMIISPWVLLSASGRRQIGLKLPNNPSSLLIGFLAGALAAVICFCLGVWFYGASTDNWFVSIARSYKLMRDTTGMSLLQLHLIFTLAACLFSPIGEEIFFRGFLQRVLEERFDVRQSTHLEAGLFGLVHLLHHGLFFSLTGLIFLPISGGIWVILMFATAWMFAWFRKSSDSLFPAIVSHMAFNATMNTLIFAYLWN